MAITEYTDDAPIGTTIASVTRRRTPVRIPAARYITQEWAEREMTAVWPKVWQLACSVDHVANAGDFFEYTIGALSVMIVRGDDGELRAFQNVCRHRGNELCHGSGTGLSEIRCGYHRWSWDLRGRLREVPSRKGFGTLRNDDFPLIPVQVGTWGPLVFVNLDTEAGPLDEYLAPVPQDLAIMGIEDFRCTALVSVPLPANWKTLIEGFSEVYHIQGIHREMLYMCDDINSPQEIWERHGRLVQPYGLPSPRLRDQVDDQLVWEAFVDVMGARVGVPDKTQAGRVPEVPPGQTLRDVLAQRVREICAAKDVDLSSFSTEQLMDLRQYNLFPNITVLVFPDLMSVIRARPGATPDDCVMDSFAFQRRPAHDATPRTKPADITMSPDKPIFGMVINQDVGNMLTVQRGLHQPGFTHLAISGEECRIINLHRNLERYTGVSEMFGGEPED
ncbi:MAG TPA: aromatic ring-hydroxylating dioxygenase subunit alpha [Acidimicrobiales bacterium]|jgi:phenylpropionate dioxygenase-like ring-hydroxylating dioxygenase large terminal subunit|nr:aromatic ring-hydroxylating dioxygenase subunit alpha [Acidimicrobiales bacterium]